MAERGSRNQLIEQYSERVLHRMDAVSRAGHIELLRPALDTVIYGPIVARYVGSAVDLDNFGDHLSAGKVDDKVVAQAVDVLAEAAVNSEAQYSLLRPGVLNNPRFREAMVSHHENVDRGAIELVQAEYGMTPHEGFLQVTFADDALTGRDLRIQPYLAGINYAAFTSGTMRTGRDFIEGDHTSLQYWTERDMQEAMPHLVLSNIAIGEVAGALFRLTAEREIPFQLIDTGSGTGATLGGAVLGIDTAIKSGVAFDPRTTVLAGIECTKHMYDQLGMFGPVALARLNESGQAVFPSEPVLLDNPEWELLPPGQLTLIYGDVAKSIQALDFTYDNAEGITVVTANYSWHRIPTMVKDRIIKDIMRKSNNVIFVIADLVQNGSEVNRRYFNFRDNGLLNCGNTNLNLLFAVNRITHFDLSEDTAPAGMDPSLAHKIGQGTTSDAIFRIGYSGSLAKSLIESWR